MRNFSIITCEFMAAKVSILLLCATTVVVQLCLADEDTPGVLDSTSVEVKFTKEPEDAIVAPGQNTNLSCQVSVNGSDKPTYYLWKLNNNEIVRKLKSSGTYTVSAKKLKNGEGKYNCIANTTYGLLRSRSVHVQIAEISLPPAEKLGPSIINATVGENVRLTCDLISIPEVEITWKFRNQHIPKRIEKYLISSKYLYINNVQKFDTGEYSCEGRNRLVSDGITVLSFSLFVTSSSPSKLDFISPKLPSNMLVQRGKNLSLHCHTNRADAEVRWAEIKEVDRGGVSSVDTRVAKSHYTLDFGEIKSEIAVNEKYSCVAKAKDAKGEDDIKPQIVDIKIGDGPIITSISSSRKSIRMGIPVRFHCNVTGYPLPSVKWYHNGEEVVSNRDHRITLKPALLSQTSMSYGLVINSIVSGDKGVYQCVAENQFGYTSRATVLDIDLQGHVPSKVIDVKCTPLSTTEIMITFNYTNDPDAPPLEYKENTSFNDDDSGDANAQVLHVADVFLVTYHREDNVTDQRVVTTFNGSAQITCLPDTNYVFFVKRYNGHQGSEPSDGVVCSTIGDTPLKLKYDRIYSDTVLISWRELDQQTFKIEATANETEVFSKITNNSFVIINNLNLNVQYEVKVSSSKRNNFEPIKFTLNPEENKCVFQFYKINESSVVFIWSLINLDLDLLDGFVIRYEKRNQENTVLESFIPRKETSFIVHGLSPGKSYDAYLFVTIRKEKALVGRTNFTMDMQTPTPKLMASTFTSCDSAEPPKTSNITFIWYYPWELTGPIFLVRLQKHDSDEEPQLRVVAREDEKQYTFDNLLENTKYDISVRVFSSNGESSNYTEPKTCTTGRSRVGRVTEITLTQRDPNTVSVSWKKPNTTTFDENTDKYIVAIQERSHNKLPETTFEVLGNVTSTEISNLKTDIEYQIKIRTEGLPGEKGAESKPKFIKLKQPEPEPPEPKPNPEPESNETLIGLIIGGSISLVSCLLCIISAFYGKKFLKRYYLEKRAKQENILPRNSTVFQNSTTYSNGASPLLRNGGCVIGRPQVHSIDGVRYCPGAGIRTIRYENDILLNGDLPMDESFHSFMDLPDKERDNEGGDSGYGDKNLSQSPPLQDCNAKRVRKFSDGATDEGFHDSNMNGSSSSPV